jgi:RimJ/RimL family protein N-acetyltransferase
MTIRKAETSDLEQMLKIYAYAREQMRKGGNPTQWGTSYPPVSLLQNDISAGKSYVVEHGHALCGTFYFSVENDATYAHIENGSWLNHEPYGVIHRIASNGEVSGILHICLAFCQKMATEMQVNNIRIDTHLDNKIMQHLLSKEGFTLCGTIFLSDGAPRIAYQKCLK